MKLRLTDLTDKTLVITLEVLAKGYGLRGLASAGVYETADEALASLGERNDDEQA